MAEEPEVSSLDDRRAMPKANRVYILAFRKALSNE